MVRRLTPLECERLQGFPDHWTAGQSDSARYRQLGNAVAVQPPGAFGGALDRLGAAGKRVQVDPGSAASWIFERLDAAGASLYRAADPCQLPKARKNPVELAGTRTAHRRDGAAMTRFLAWLAHETAASQPREIAVSDRLETFRHEGENFRDLSFATISGAGSNGSAFWGAGAADVIRGGG